MDRMLSATVTSPLPLPNPSRSDLLFSQSHSDVLQLSLVLHTHPHLATKSVAAAELTLFVGFLGDAGLPAHPAHQPCQRPRLLPIAALLGRCPCGHHHGLLLPHAASSFAVGGLLPFSALKPAAVNARRLRLP